MMKLAFDRSRAKPQLMADLGGCVLTAGLEGVSDTALIGWRGVPSFSGADTTSDSPVVSPIVTM
jgi:hypothetical protein